MIFAYTGTNLVLDLAIALSALVLITVFLILILRSGKIIDNFKKLSGKNTAENNESEKNCNNNNGGEKE